MSHDVNQSIDWFRTQQGEVREHASVLASEIMRITDDLRVMRRDFETLLKAKWSADAQLKAERWHATYNAALQGLIGRYEIDDASKIAFKAATIAHGSIDRTTS